MKGITIACLAALLGCALAFQGQYADSTESGGYGGSLFVCVDDEDFHGLYSEFGVMYGQLSEDRTRVAGTWYEGGEGGCLSGPFEFELTEDGFTGYWACKGDEETRYTWEEPRLNSGRPQDVQCARLDVNGRVSGEYSHPDYEFLFLCADDGDTYGSYEFLASEEYYEPGTPNTLGYERGETFLNDAISGGFFCEDSGSCGTSVWFRLKDGGGVVNVWWYFQETYEDDGRIVLSFPPSPRDHSVDLSFTRIGDPTDAECRQHDQLSDFATSFYTVSSVGLASATVPALALTLLAIAAMLL